MSQKKQTEMEKERKELVKGFKLESRYMKLC